MAHVAPWKVEAVSDLVSALTAHPTVGVVSIEGIAASQLQKMRAIMRVDVTMIVSKSTLLDIALKEASKKGRKGLDGLAATITGPCAIVVTDRNPFKLFKLMESTKAPAAAKGGELAPNDILIKGGDTNFKPGPIVRDLQKVGIPAAIDKGKVVIRKDAVLVKKGEVISKDVAQVLPKLDIMPLIVGLDLRAAFEDGVVYRPDVLKVDEVAVRAQFGRGAVSAFNLAMALGYPTPYTIKPLLLMARTHALALGVEAGVVNEETAAPIIQKSHYKALALAMRLSPEALDDEIRARLAGAAAAAPAAASAAPAAGAGAKDEADKKEDKEEKKVTEEDAAAGLSALFG
jgi:large subunit ribosomal protein L10